MTTKVKETINFKLNGEDISAPEGTVILDAAKRKGVWINNLCSSRKLKPFAACRTCMVEVIKTDGSKELVYSCTQPVIEGSEVTVHTEETDRYNKACLEMLLVEHPLDCAICDKSGVCPLQDNTDALNLYDGRFEIQRRNEPSIKTNPAIEFYLNRCIMCGMCVRICDETQGVQALDFHKRGMAVTIGTANEEPLDCEFCGQCITICPTGALMDLTVDHRGLAALYTNTKTTCNYCSWGCTVKIDTKKGKVMRIEADDNLDVGINDGNLCAKGRFGYGIIQNGDRIQTPLMNVGGEFKEVSWAEAIDNIKERFQSSLNRTGPQSIAGIGGEKLTNEENFLFQKLFRKVFGSNQITNLPNLCTPYLNQFTVDCFANGIVSKPITELAEADVVLVFNSDLPSEYPVCGNSVRTGAIFEGTDIIIANPRKVVFHNEAKVDIRLTYKLGNDVAVANRLSKILIDNNIVDTGKLKSALPNYDDFVKSISKYTAEHTEKLTGLNDVTLTKAAEQFGANADRFIICGNDILETGDGEAVLKALLNLSIIVQHGGEGSISIYPPREHCNSQGINDMGVTPEFLPGYQPSDDPAALSALAKEWGMDGFKFDEENLAIDLFENCKKGLINLLYIAGEDPVHSYYQGSLVKEALRHVPFMVVQDVYMTETAQMANLVLPTATYAEKEGTFTNMTRHVQRVSPAVISEGQSRPDFDIFHDVAEAMESPFVYDSVQELQEEITNVVPAYKGMMPGRASKQWAPAEAGQKPEFQVSDVEPTITSDENFPYHLVSNNDMFHIGSYSQKSEALVEFKPDCIAEINSQDARELGIKSGDRIEVQSKSHKVEVPVEVNNVTSKGQVYIPKNWPAIPINLMRNGGQEPVSVKITKVG
ncbi:MAG: molybdopterin-dependent oxidoreductase [Nitrospinales bacterium]